jgi:PAS domain S-box-containing protein
MDGKRPETAGGSLPVDSRTEHREQPLPYSDRSFDSLENGRKQFDENIPELDWGLLSQLSLPGENASLSLHDGNGVFIKITGGYENLWNRSEQEILGSRISDFIEPNEAFSNWFLSLNNDAQNNVFSTSISDGRSQTVPIFLKRIPLFIGSQPSHSRIVLKAVAANAKTAAEPPPSLFFSCDSNGALTSGSEAWSNRFGIPQDQSAFQTLCDIIEPEDRTALTTYLDTLKKSGRSETKSLRFKSSQGKIRTLLLSGEFSQDQFDLFAQDLTLDPVELAKNLKAVSEKLSSTALAWIDLSEDNCRIIEVNNTFKQFTGYRESEIPTFEDLFGESIENNVTSQAISSIQEGIEESFELRLHRKNGDSIWVSLRTFPLRDQDGKLRYTAFTIADITNEKNSQKTSIQQENLRSIGQMASGIAHDFNNLLAPILGFSELLLNMPNGGRDDKKLISFLEKIKVAAQDGAAVVSRLRDFYGNQDSGEEVTSDIDLKKLAQQVKDLTQHRWKSQAEARGAKIEFKSIVESRHCVHGNEPELRQALSNLVINAADAIEGDGVITLSIVDEKDNVCIKIQDTGCGMPESIRAKCLDPFYSTKGKLGTGLGLSIVAGIVKRHKGEIEIESIEGSGSTITIQLPAVDAIPAKVDKKVSSESSHSLRIMLVDDEAVLLEVLSELLGSGGHQVRKFEDGEAALDAFKKEPFDLVITDRAMPNMSGEELAAKIKAINSRTPIIMATGFGDMMSDDAETSKNVDLVLAKPVPLDVLNQKLSELTSSDLN